MQKSFDKFTQMGSGWTKEKNVKLELCMAKFHSLAASSHLELPPEIVHKRAILNILNKSDNKCMVWCILAHTYKISFDRHAYSVSNYEPHGQEVKLSNIECSVPLKKYRKLKN